MNECKLPNEILSIILQYNPKILFSNKSLFNEAIRIFGNCHKCNMINNKIVDYITIYPSNNIIHICMNCINMNRKVIKSHIEKNIYCMYCGENKQTSGYNIIYNFNMDICIECYNIIIKKFKCYICKDNTMILNKKCITCSKRICIKHESKQNNDYCINCDRLKNHIKRLIYDLVIFILLTILLIFAVIIYFNKLDQIKLPKLIIINIIILIIIIISIVNFILL